MVVPVIVTGSPMAESMQRLVLTLSNAKREANHMFLTYPTQKVDTHVKELDKSGNPAQYWRSYLVGVLLGRNFELLHPALLYAMRRYLFFSEPMPAWLVRLVAHPAHIMIVNGV